MIFTKESPFYHPVKETLQKLRQSGILMDLIGKYNQPKSSCVDEKVCTLV